MEVDPRERLHRLVDHLPEAEVYAAARYLEYLSECGDPLVGIATAAPEEDEELSERGHRFLDEGREDLAAGRTHTLNEVKRELDLRPGPANSRVRTPFRAAPELQSKLRADCDQ